jgi:S1-C subfamily serine protease
VAGHTGTGTAAALDAYSRIVAAVAARLIPSVAALRVTARRGGRGGAGSAVVLSPDGLLVTSAHVVAGSGRGLASFTDGDERPYEVVGVDRLSDLAVVRVAGGGLCPAEIGDAATLVVGQLVVAVGNPLGFAGSVSAGVVSALGRSLAVAEGRHVRLIEDVIQTDASLHPGNSGGALATAAAEVVGISTAVVGPGLGQGLGLAVPLNDTTKRIVGSLVREGRVRRAYLGVAGGSRPLPPRVAERLGRRMGLEVTDVIAGTPAAAAGVRPEDIIVALDGAPVSGAGDLQRFLDAGRVGRPVTLTIVRAGRLLDLDVVPAELAGA